LGGRLVYATCTLLPEENEQVVTAFLAGQPDWTLEEEHTLFPPDSGTDGFYYARLRRGEAHAEL
jgi:16S rRNA (cytosine967-C5)-methyltransferase